VIRQKLAVYFAYCVEGRGKIRFRQLILGSGQDGNVQLSPEADAFFAKKNCEVVIKPTPQAIRAFNEAPGKKIGLFHVPVDGLLRLNQFVTDR
jgi:hypothetical protein